ncbi:serine/threonine-protein kinase STY8-like [Durio zibethinus]|uniref:Serine/threonine-protein kinase STY8-like n=1 Tax=Durio zibethinus TaxID=66656 RepID=A0A6P5XL46_DURZI|nr:serine/threonine-protein kinase STY8-like [Durio zibethinus]
MNSAAGNPEQKKATLSHYQRALVTSPLVKIEKATTPTPSSRQYCRRFNDCFCMGSAAATSPQLQQQERKQQRLQLSTSKLEQQVTDLEKEVQKQKEILTMYKMRTERTQDNLRYCLQIAQENGFLDLITNNKSPISPDVVNVGASPQVPASVSQQSDLGKIISQAKMNGWYIDPVEIELQELIGQGSTADIYRGIWRGVDVAVKCIYPDFFHKNEKGVTFFAQEVETLSRQRHRFILQLMGACLNPPTQGWVVTEFLSMTLKDWLHGPGNNRGKERVTPLPPFEERLTRAVEIAQAMQYLHEQKPKVVHRDLKPSNIFLDDAKHVRVADFGHARFLGDEEMALTGETGKDFFSFPSQLRTYVYMAPEVIRYEPYNEKCDVYSFGIILNELITGNYPYVETNYGPAKIAMEVAEGKLRPALPEDNGELGKLIDLICQSWDGDASVRPSFANITSTLQTIQNRIKENC